MVPIRNPSLDEFLIRARHTFAFLVAEFAFDEQPSPRHTDVNPYQVRYLNATTSATVEGINWGYGVSVLLGPTRRRILRRDDAFPLWPLVKLRRPDLYRSLWVGDQLEQLAAHAVALRECAAEVLRGDFDIRSEVERLLRQQTPAGRRELADSLHSQAVAHANEAFRCKDYQRVVDILAPLEEQLTPAQRLKLEYAKKHRC